MTLSTGMFAQTKSEDSQSGDDNNYCAKNEMNKIIVVYRGAAIIDDAKLENGTLVKIDGTLIMKDGSKTLLREGQCINRDGTMPTPSE
ncbi:MAG: DUF6799 domain-containing protein [Bacteroidia bacterium]